MGAKNPHDIPQEKLAPKTMRSILLLALSAPLAAQSISGTLSSGTQLLAVPMSLDVSTAVTNTQATLLYTAPNSSPCTIEVSESGSYAPAVIDADGTLFTGSNLDTRTGALTNGTRRAVVIGKRTVELATDGKKYSRALQANTLHYYRVTCGSSVGTGTFTTENIPFEMRYQDIPQLDPSTAGATMLPTLSTTDRTQAIIDPHTGAQIRRVSLPGDIPYDSGNINATGGPFMYFGGFTRVCGTSLVGSPAIGYLCSFSQGNGGVGVLYYIIPSTGEVRYLGRNAWGAAYPFINPVNSKFYILHNATDIVEKTYTGDYSAATPGSTASFSSSTIFTGLQAAIQAFAPSYSTSNFSCGDTGGDIGIGVSGDYIELICRRGVQDTYGFIAVVRISTASVVAVTRVDANIQSRWCGLHEIVPMYDQPLMEITTHGFVGGGLVGEGPYQNTYSGGSTLAAGSTTIAVSGEPSCPACGADSSMATAQVGDTFTWMDGSGDRVTIVTKTSPTSWITTATASSHAPGAVLEGTCMPYVNAKGVFWKFLADPTGADATNTNFVTDSHWPLGGHDDARSDVLLTEHWMIRAGNLLAGVNTAPTATINESATFAGALAQCYGVGCVSHPSAGPPGAAWITDYFMYDGAVADEANLVPIAGQLYKYVHASGYSVADVKHFAIAGVVKATYSGGPFSLRDISGPGSSISTGAGGSYTWCRANAVNECQSGSASGDEFVNIPSPPSRITATLNAAITTTGQTSISITITSGYIVEGNYISVRAEGSNTAETMLVTATPFHAPVSGETATVTVTRGQLGSAASLHASGATVEILSCVNNSSACLNNYNAYANGILQIGLDGVHTRVVSGGLTGLRNANGFPTAKALADGSYLIFEYGDPQYQVPAQLLMAKLPPFTSGDSIDRTTFVRAAVSITAPTGLGVASAAVEFGYHEFGTPSQHFCTSRLEACVAVAATVTDATPFKYASTDTYSRLPCAVSCSITLPVLPMHTAYYTVKYYDAGGTLVASGPSGIASEGTVIPLP